MKRLLWPVFFLTVAAVITWVSRLLIIENLITYEFKVPEITVEKLYNQAGQYHIFDIRSEEEYLAGHIENATWVDEKTKAEDFIENYSEMIKAKPSVFYCSIGYRSSALVKEVAARAKQHQPFFNLRGGLFRWHREGLPVAGGGVHPYNTFWGLFR